MSDAASASPGSDESGAGSSEVVGEVAVAIREGLHARPVMRFVDYASRFQSTITVQNISRRGEKVDGKSAMQMMLLEASIGNILRITASGADAQQTVDALVALVKAGFDPDSAKASS